MKRIIMLALGLAFLAPVGDAGIGLVYNSDVSVTQTNSAVTFTDNGSAGNNTMFEARQLLVRSLAASANTCFFDVKDKVATTSDIALEPGGSISLTWQPQGGNDGWPGLGAICSSGQTATFRVTAMR